jgi:DNA-binding response OmpR family regulator
MIKNKVLVVDDEPDVLLLTCTALEDAGYEVIRAEDVPAARRLLLSEIPDVIVTDLMMPDESGFSLIGTVRENPGMKTIPIVVTSVMESESEVLQMGADAFVAKPFSPEELVKVVRELVSKEEIPKLLDKSREAIKQKKYGDAKELLQRVLSGATDPTYLAFGSFYLGEVNRLLGDVDEAEKLYKTAIQHNTQFWRAYNQLGSIYSSLSDYRRALAYWEKSLLINKDQPELQEEVRRLQKEIVG